MYVPLAGWANVNRAEALSPTSSFGQLLPVEDAKEAWPPDMEEVTQDGSATTGIPREVGYEISQPSDGVAPNPLTIATSAPTSKAPEVPGGTTATE